MNKKANTPTLADELEHATNHYSKSLADVDFLRVELGLAENAIRRQLDNHAAPPTPIGELATEQGRTVRGALVALCDFLKRAETNPAYKNGGELGDCLFYWWLVAPLVCEYLKRRGTDGETTARLAGLVTEAKPPATASKGGLCSAVNPFAVAGGAPDFEKAVLGAVDSDAAQSHATRKAEKANGAKRKKRRGCTYAQAVEILERLNVPRTRQTIAKWRNGRNTPEGFTPETMGSVQSFTAWATIYANREQSKINFDEALRIDNPGNRKMGKFK